MDKSVGDVREILAMLREQGVIEFEGLGIRVVLGPVQMAPPAMDDIEPQKFDVDAPKNKPWRGVRPEDLRFLGMDD